MNESKLLPFIKQIPMLCGATNAARRGHDFEVIFHAELDEGESSVYARNEDDEKNPENRFYLLFEMPVPADMDDKKMYCIKLILITAIAHLEVKYGIYQFGDRKEKLISDCALDYGRYPDVDALYTVEDAVKGWWNG
jgi:hypothetical protein